MQHNEYDITAAFQKIEEELIASMIRNMDRHRAEETAEGYEWSMWQTEQLKALEKYKKNNQKKYKKQFNELNRQIRDLIREARNKGGMKQEIQILQAIKKGWKVSGKNKAPERHKMTAEFFQINDRKLDALIEATVHDMEKAETAILRKANDDYRKAIFDAQVYANSGAGTYEKAVDMATKDMLSRGLNCVEYSNGARHTLPDYADMAIRTASKRAYLQGEGEKRQEWGIHTVIMAKRGNPCPKCLPFVGKVLIDDVWSGGSGNGNKGTDPETGKKYPLMSYAISKGLYHPRCKDSHTTYFPGISTANDAWSKEELEAIGLQNQKEVREQYMDRQEEKYKRLTAYSLDEENQEQYKHKEKMWKDVRFRTGKLDRKKYEESKRPLADFHPLPQEKVVDVLRKESKEWIQTLSEKEQHAIQKYTYNSGDKKPNRFFERLNAMLRGERLKEEKLMQYADIISAALQKNKLKQDILCYRNMEFNPYEKYDIGTVFIDNQFISTSVIKNAALSKSFKLIFFVPKGSRGAYIEQISKYPKQREFLLDRNCKMRILSKQKDSVLVEVIP